MSQSGTNLSFNGCSFYFDSDQSAPTYLQNPQQKSTNPSPNGNYSTDNYNQYHYPSQYYPTAPPNPYPHHNVPCPNPSQYHPIAPPNPNPHHNAPYPNHQCYNNPSYTTPKQYYSQIPSPYYNSSAPAYTPPPNPYTPYTPNPYNFYSPYYSSPYPQQKYAPRLLPSPYAQEPLQNYPIPRQPGRILVFGSSGSGKSSLINSLTQRYTLETSNSAIGCTMEPTEVEAADGTVFVDTAGLNEALTGKVPGPAALHSLVKLLKDNQVGFSLIIYVWKAGRILSSDQANFKLFVQDLNDNQVPVIAVITGLEDKKDMQGWVEENKSIFTDSGMWVSAMVGTTFKTMEEGDDPALVNLYHQKRIQSAYNVWNLISNYSDEIRPIYTNDSGFLVLLKRLWNSMCDKINMKDYMVSINQTVVNLLVGLGYTHSNAKKEAMKFFF